MLRAQQLSQHKVMWLTAHNRFVLSIPFGMQL